jgi:DNA-binding transcriptional regulator YbjK
LADRSHALKGLTGNLALLPLYQYFSALEKAADGHRLGEMSAAMGHIAAIWSDFAEDIERLEASLEPVSQASDTEGSMSVQEQIEQLTEWLYITESGEIDDELSESLLQGVRSDIEPLVRQAAHAIDEFEFKEAVKHIYQARTLLRQ